MSENAFLNVISNIEQRAAVTIKVVDGDYQKDGLWYCGNCNTPKQVRIDLFGTERTPFCLCKCAVEKRQEEEKQRQQIEFEKQIAKYRLMGFADEKLKAWNFENDDMANSKLTNAMKRYVENFKRFKGNGKGLLLWGDSGTGKTYAACEVANALIDEGYPVLVTNFPHIIDTIQSNMNKEQEYIESLNKFALVVIDDLGVERQTQYMQEKVYKVIDSRYRSGLPMILTTNLNIKEIKNPNNIDNARIYDRILEKCFPIEVAGKSRRHKKAAQDYFEVKDILGL